LISIIGFTRSRRIICQAQALGLEHSQLGLRCRRARGPGGGDTQAACDRHRWREMVSRLWFLLEVNTVVSKCAGPYMVARMAAAPYMVARMAAAPSTPATPCSPRTCSRNCAREGRGRRQAEHRQGGNPEWRALCATRVEW